RALAVLHRGGPQRLGELAERLRIAPRSATEVVDALAERGLVERRPDPADRRATLVALTAHGEEVSAAIRAARKTGAGSLFARLPPPDQEELARLLTNHRAAVRPPDSGLRRPALAGWGRRADRVRRGDPAAPESSSARRRRGDRRL